MVPVWVAHSLCLLDSAVLGFCPLPICLRGGMLRGMSRLRRMVLSDRFFFVSYRMVRHREPFGEGEFKQLAGVRARSERKGRRGLDTALEWGAGSAMAAEGARTAKVPAHAACSALPGRCAIRAVSPIRDGVSIMFLRGEKCWVKTGQKLLGPCL